VNAVPQATYPIEQQLAELTRTVDAQRTTIEALIAAAERRTAGEPDSAAIATWQRNLTLQQRVTERTNRVRAAERLLRSVIDSLDAGLCILAADGSIIDTNRVWGQMLSAQAESGEADARCFFTLGRSRTGGLGELLRDAAVSVTEVLAGGAPEAGIERPVEVGGEQRWWKAQVIPVRGHDAAQVVVTVTDVTRQVRTAAELRQATKDTSRLALVARHMDDAVVIADEHGVIEWVNAAFTEMTGYTAAEVLGRVRAGLGATQAFPTLDEVTPPNAEFEPPERLTQTKDGRPYWLKAELFRVIDEDGIVRFVAVERDVTARREAEETLLEAIGHSESLANELSTEKAVLTGVISSIPHLTYWKDFAGRYHGHNAAFLAMREIAPDASLLGRTEDELGFTDEFSGTLLEIEKQVLHSGQPVVDKQVTIARPDGATRTVLMSLLPQPDGGMIGVGADVTRVSELERQLNQNNRLEAIGQLAAGIAHEINTPIQFISDNTRFVAQSLTELLDLAALADRSCTESAGNPAAVVAALSPVLTELDVEFLVAEIPSALHESLEGLERVAQIVRAMKDFSHPGQGRSAIDLNRAIESTVQVARNEWKYCAEMELSLSPDVSLVPCYEGEFKQVILNLIVNAAHAIQACPRDDSGLGRIRIATIRFADRIEVSIQDDGTGMDAATQQRIFDPFFTTKEVGKGTGQGLSMAYASIVQKHGGALRVDSAPGAGTTFTIVLPASTDAEPVSP
jgi:PAS domain S-box-containing protein